MRWGAQFALLVIDTINTGGAYTTLTADAQWALEFESGVAGDTDSGVECSALPTTVQVALARLRASPGRRRLLGTPGRLRLLKPP
jgi:hypothetical protein